MPRPLQKNLGLLLVRTNAPPRPGCPAFRAASRLVRHSASTVSSTRESCRIALAVILLSGGAYTCAIHTSGCGRVNATCVASGSAGGGTTSFGAGGAVGVASAVDIVVMCGQRCVVFNATSSDVNRRTWLSDMARCGFSTIPASVTETPSDIADYSVAGTASLYPDALH